MAPDEMHLYIEEQLARIRQLNVDAEHRIQEMVTAPLRIEVVVAVMVAVGLLAGTLGYTLAATQGTPTWTLSTNC